MRAYGRMSSNNPSFLLLMTSTAWYAVSHSCNAVASVAPLLSVATLQYMPSFNTTRSGIWQIRCEFRIVVAGHFTLWNSDAKSIAARTMFSPGSVECVRCCSTAKYSSTASYSDCKPGVRVTPAMSFSILYPSFPPAMNLSQPTPPKKPKTKQKKKNDDVIKYVSQSKFK